MPAKKTRQSVAKKTKPRKVPKNRTFVNGSSALSSQSQAASHARSATEFVNASASAAKKGHKVKAKQKKKKALSHINNTFKHTSAIKKKHGTGKKKK